MHQKVYQLQDDIKGCLSQGSNRLFVNWNVSSGGQRVPDEDVDTVSSDVLAQRTHAPVDELPI